MDELINTAKLSFWSGFASADITFLSAACCFAWALLISIYVFALYKTMKKSSFYSKEFGLSLIVLAIIVSSIILVIQSNIVISLGMVGALSIVRYRTAIKDPLDLVFLFWSISAGLICGAGFAGIAVLASAVMTVVILMFDRAAVFVAPKVLVINGDDLKPESAVTKSLEKYCEHYEIKAHNIRAGHIDMAIEVKTSKERELLNAMMKIKGITSASLVAHSGDVTI